MFWFAFEYPFYAYSVLQALYLLPTGFSPSLLPSVPFKNVFLPRIDPTEWSSQSWSSLVSFMLRDFSHPFVLALLRDRISNLVFPKLYVWIRELLVKPNRPDGVSLQSASANLNIVPGEIMGGTVRRLAKTKGTIKGLLGRWLSNVLWFSLTILHTQRVAMAIELSPEIEEALLIRSNVHYHALARQYRQRGIRRSSRTLRVESIRAAFHDFNLDPDSSMVDIFELADEMSLSASSLASTSTPDPRDLPTLGPQIMPASPLDENELDNLVIRRPDEDRATRSASPRVLSGDPSEGIDLAFPEVGVADPVIAAAEALLIQAANLQAAISSESHPQATSNGGQEASTSRPPSSARNTDILNTSADAAEVLDAELVNPSPILTFSHGSGEDSALVPEETFEESTPSVVIQEQSFQPAVPLETLLESASPGAVLDLTDAHSSARDLPSPAGSTDAPQARSRRRSSPPTIARSSPERLSRLSPARSDPPFGGISRAPRLPNATPLRPLRRPTVSDQHVPRFREEVGRRDRNLDYLSEPDTTVLQVDTYRVTILSNHAAEAFAYHATSLLESIILLPLDVMFTRSLAINFLAGATAQQVDRPQIGDIWPPSLRVQIRELPVVQTMAFLGNFLVTIGIQGLINLGVWSLGTAVTLRLGERYGWGQI